MDMLYFIEAVNEWESRNGKKFIIGVVSEKEFNDVCEAAKIREASHHEQTKR